MTRLVFDASAGVELLLDTERGRSLADQLPEGASWWVPEHYYVEVAGALRRAELRAEVPAERVQRAFELLGDNALHSVALGPLLSEAWVRRKSVTVADALYVVLAQHLNATLVTADIKLARAPQLGVPTITPVLHGTNELLITGERFLLGGGASTHLIRQVGEGPGRPAVSDWEFERHESWQDAYDLRKLREPIWSERTICGRDWQRMDISTGPPIGRWDEPMVAPDCRSCLRIIGRRLAATEPDPRIPRVARLAVASVIERGDASIFGVPGDQAENLREAIRLELRENRLTGRTFLHDRSVLVFSEQAYNLVPEEIRREHQWAIVDVLEAAWSGRRTTPLEDRRIHWDSPMDD